MTQLVKYGLKLSDLTEETLKAIVLIYDSAVGGRGCQFLQPKAAEKLTAWFKNNNTFEWRFGSRLTPHSKLFIHCRKIPRQNEPIIYFRFSANLEPERKNDEKGAEKISQEFNDRVKKFLKEKNLAIELPG